MSNYDKGVALERRLVKQWLKEGATYCYRTAGSHSALDVFALFPKYAAVAQCQVDSYFPPGKREALKEIIRQCPYVKAYLVFKEGKKIIIAEVQND